MLGWIEALRQIFVRDQAVFAGTLPCPDQRRRHFVAIPSCRTKPLLITGKRSREAPHKFAPRATGRSEDCFERLSERLRVGEMLLTFLPPMKGPEIAPCGIAATLPRGVVGQKAREQRFALLRRRVTSEDNADDSASKNIKCELRLELGALGYFEKAWSCIELAWNLLCSLNWMIKVHENVARGALHVKRDRTREPARPDQQVG